MVELGFIEEFAYYDAMVFMDLRRAYEASQGVKWRAMTRDLLETLGLSAGEATEIYDAVKHEIGLPRAINVINSVIEAMTNNFNDTPAVALDHYRVAIDELVDAMQEVNKARKEKLQKGLAHA
jgi:NTP pyrophosphatase (non-canonical NTP hydrolase)